MLSVASGLVEKWQGLEGKSEQLQKMRSLHREMTELKEVLLEINKRASFEDHDDLQDRDQLNKKILQIEVSCALLVYTRCKTITVLLPLRIQFIRGQDRCSFYTPGV